ncbi:MAG: dephospho-CoA kinase [Nevskiales bacterium]|nr:dephospho-CoA kinase [Nevskiales bacterium]
MTIGLTGGIASGKSLVVKSFVTLGVPVLDGDIAAREITAPGSPALRKIARRFGTEYLHEDGRLNRRKLRERVFADPTARKALERITHPLIRARLIAWRDAQAAPYCVLAVPLLIESGMDRLVDRVLVIDTPVAVQKRRLMTRDGVSGILARQMLAAQATRKKRLACADDVIRNHDSRAELRRAVHRLHERYLRLARTSGKRSPRSGNP